MLFLGLLATLPVGSTIPGLILAVMAVQLIVGRAEPIFTHFIMARRNSSARRRCCLGVGIGARPSLTHQTLDRRARWLLQCNRNNRRCVGSAYRRDARCGSRAPVADRFAGSFAWCVRRRRERQPLQPIGQKPKLRAARSSMTALNRVAVAQCGIQQLLRVIHRQPQGGRFILRTKRLSLDDPAPGAQVLRQGSPESSLGPSGSRGIGWGDRRESSTGCDGRAQNRMQHWGLG
jgi:hypothetical protein